MKILKGKPEAEIISESIKNLNQGGLIIYPTETCYGLGVDATNAKAVNKVFIFKGGKRKRQISIAVADQKMAEKYVFLNKTALNLYHHFLPGPLTVVSKSKAKTDRRLESKQGTLGIRIPKHDLLLKILKAFGKPITATSANISSGKNPYQIKDVFDQISNRKEKLISLIIDAGRLPFNPPSTVIDTTLNEPQVLRQGEIDFDKLGAKNVISSSAIQTQRIAASLIKNNLKNLGQKTLVFALQGELGAGKTQFAKGLGRGLMIKEKIVSPTFTIIMEHDYKNGVFYHIDAWRLASEPQALAFIKDFLRPGNVIAIEWVQKGKELLRSLKHKKNLKVFLIDVSHQDKNTRLIKIAEG